MLKCDVLVVGGGNAALVSAITCAEHKRNVLLVESSPMHERGGNTKYTRDIRYAHQNDSFTTGEYTKQEFLKDLESVSESSFDRKMAELVIEDSTDITRWMQEHGVIFKRDIKGTLSLSRTNAFFLGGGKALVNAYYRCAERLGVRILYNTEVKDLIFKERSFEYALADNQGMKVEIKAKQVIVASGGFEANVEKLREVWGNKAERLIVRGSRHNTGLPLFSLLRNGAQSVGSEKSGHMIAVDARSPRFEGGIVTRIDAIPIGIVLNKRGDRFYDEGEDLWPKRYAIWGHLISEQEDQIAYAIVDSKMINDFLPTAFQPFTASDLHSLFSQIEIDRERAIKTVSEFNKSVVQGNYNKSILDDCHTVGINPPKSHWARRIESPPFFAYPLRPGLTFTYMGLRVNEYGKVMHKDGEFENVFAAGEIMSGNVLSKGYLGGFGLTIGTVFGRRAGENASARR